MKKSLFALTFASLITLTACTSAANTKDNAEIIPTEAATVVNTEAPTEEVTEAPTENIIEDISATEKKFTCYVDEQRIRGLVYLPEGEGPFPTVIMIAGITMNCSTFTDAAKEIAQNGVAAVTFDCRGYVFAPIFSDGDFLDMSPSSCVKDIMAVTDLISEYPAFDKDNIFVWGNSYGGIVTTLAAAENPNRFKGIIGVDPAFQMPDEFRSLFNENTEEFILEGIEIGEPLARELMEMDIFEKMKSYNGNAVILTGTNNTVDVKFPEVFDKALSSFPNAEKIVVEGAGHQFNRHRQKLAELTVDFVKKNTN